jgi:hypothetical protein
MLKQGLTLPKGKSFTSDLTTIFTVFDQALGALSLKILKLLLDSSVFSKNKTLSMIHTIWFCLL